MYKFYRALTFLASPLVTLWLYWRLKQGKEDKNRIGERFGHPSRKRPQAMLFWLHAASVGEANSVLLLIEKMRAQFPQLQILLTTGTVTSARLMQARLPEGVIHQFVPVDTPGATSRFIRYWRPDFAFFVESELWPNLVHAADYWQCYMGLINARMSARSFRMWSCFPDFIHDMLGCFDMTIAQSDADAKRLATLGAKNVACYGNLKYDAAPLPCDEAELLRLKQLIGARQVWLAASTHPGEEEQIAEVHKMLALSKPDLLTILVPRHPQRGADIAKQLAAYKPVCRSQGALPESDTGIYLADTLGELGLFYRLCEIVFMGGSLVSHGGQNPLEPARLSCAILTGPHTENFRDIYALLSEHQAFLRVENPHQLAAEIARLLMHADQRTTLARNARRSLESASGTSDRVLAALAPLFKPLARDAR